MNVVLEPNVYGLPIHLDAPPEVQVLRPDNSSRSMTLSLSPDGSYRGIYTDTPLAGPYLFSTEVSATSPGGSHVTRFRQLTGLIFYPGKTGGGGETGGGGRPGGGSEDCKKEVRVLIQKLGEIIERCCCKDHLP
jgi:hypothetical protein